MIKKIETLLGILIATVVISFIAVFSFNLFDQIFFVQNDGIIESSIGAFAGAFFAFLFLRLSDGFKKIYDRHVKYYNALVKLEHLLNRNFTCVTRNRNVIEDFRNIIAETRKTRKIVINPGHFAPFPLIDELLFDLLGQDTINNFFSYNFDISKLNGDFETINRSYENMTTLCVNKNDIESYIHHLDFLAKHIEALEKFLNHTNEITINYASEVRVLVHEHKPLFLKVMFFILPSKKPFNFARKVEKEKKILKEEMQKHYDKNKKEIDDILK